MRPFSSVSPDPTGSDPCSQTQAKSRTSADVSGSQADVSGSTRAAELPEPKPSLTSVEPSCHHRLDLSFHCRQWQHNGSPEPVSNPGVWLESVWSVESTLSLKDIGRILQLLSNRSGLCATLFGVTTWYRCFFKRIWVHSKFTSHYYDILYISCVSVVIVVVVVATICLYCCMFAYSLLKIIFCIVILEVIRNFLYLII